MRQFLAAVSLLLLAGCNMVTTKTPLFGPADVAHTDDLDPNNLFFRDRRTTAGADENLLRGSRREEASN